MQHILGRCSQKRSEEKRPPRGEMVRGVVPGHFPAGLVVDTLHSVLTPALIFAAYSRKTH